MKYQLYSKPTVCCEISTTVACSVAYLLILGSFVLFYYVAFIFTTCQKLPPVPQHSIASLEVR